MASSNIIDKPLEWNQVTANLKPAASLEKKAYDATGQKPREEAFSKSGTLDKRGAPVWKLDTWTAPRPVV